MRYLGRARFIIDHPLNRTRKLAAIKRYISWQIGSRLVPGAVVIDFVNGAKLLVSPGMAGATGNIYTGLHEFEDMAFVLHYLRPADTFADVGANIGSYTVMAGAAIGAHCIAFEPIPATYAHLKRNIDLNGINSVAVARNVGIGANDGWLTFTSGLDTENHVMCDRDPGDDSIKVEVTRLDAALSGIEPALIKIDVEGYETRVIDGAATVFSKPSLRAVIMELSGSGLKYGFDEDAVHARMLRYNFRSFAYDPFSRDLIDMHGARQLMTNTLYVRDLEVVKTRLKTAPTFRVQGQDI